MVILQIAPLLVWLWGIPAVVRAMANPNIGRRRVYEQVIGAFSLMGFALLLFYALAYEQMVEWDSEASFKRDAVSFLIRFVIALLIARCAVQTRILRPALAKSLRLYLSVWLLSLLLEMAGFPATSFCSKLDADDGTAYDCFRISFRAMTVLYSLYVLRCCVIWVGIARKPGNRPRTNKIDKSAQTWSRVFIILSVLGTIVSNVFVWGVV